MKRYVKFTTEMGNTIEMDTTLEVTNQVTGEIILASKATAEEAVIIPPRWAGTQRSVIAIRESGGKKKLYG